PAVGAVVIVRPDGATTPIRVSTTGEDGAFAFDHLEDGAYRVEVRREGYAPVVKTGIAVRAPFRAVAELLLVHGTEPPPAASSAPSGTDGHRVAMKGMVRLLAGAAVSEAHVRLTRVDGGDDPRALLSGLDGRFAVDGLAAGTWRIEILGAGLLPLRTTIDLVADTTLEAQLATQPANYQPSPQDLIVPEEAIPPKGA
ncbi:MAG TPA: carboxypeptidase-like regulatory domain-containing protein, partial [Candidatus Sulfotelmatobacter sp.]|nr:carboxypeptidase-like regulatory domain-containing protein [Candidatus Sulfotelmatobacter sp.]